MKPILFALGAIVAVQCCGEAVASPGIHVTAGAVYFEDAAGRRSALANATGDGAPVLSPDRTKLAWSHADSSSDDPTSIWIFDAVTDQRRMLYRSGDRWIEGAPAFSLDGGYLYFNTGAGGPGCTVHQVSIATGREKTVTGGGCLASVLRSGPYRGYLIVQRHLYRSPAGGSYEVDYVVRPDGVDQFTIPGTQDEAQPNARNDWLKSKRWTAW